jgi:hypothetical protein
MNFWRLNDVRGFGEAVDKAFKRLRMAAENANNWSVTGDCTWNASAENGFSLYIPRRMGVFPAVSTSIITAAPSANKAGKGKCTTRAVGVLDDDLINNTTGVDVYSNFRVSVPSGTRLMVAERGPNAVWLIGADCPLT